MHLRRKRKPLHVKICLPLAGSQMSVLGERVGEMGTEIKHPCGNEKGLAS